MNTRYNLTLIGTVLAITALSLPLIISETSPKPEIPSTPDLVLIGTLLEFGCSELAINHLMDSSNLLDEEFDGAYIQNFMGLPDGLSEEDFDKCLQIVISIREGNYTTTPEPKLDSKEHYTIEITGLKDVYIVGERYDFSYVLSGYGHPCGGKTVTFPDSNGDTIGNASSASCIANLPMGIFVFDIQKEQGTTYGHIGIKNPGTYTVTVTFDRPSQYFPTTASQEFRVVEE